MDARKYGQSMQQQHQPLFKQINAASVKGVHQGDSSSTYNQFKQQSEQLHLQMGVGEHQHITVAQRKEGGSSVGLHPSNNLKSYSNRGSSQRVPSQIINSTAQQSHNISGVQVAQRITDDSYEGLVSKNMFKIEYQQPQKQQALTRKHSKVNTLVNSLMSNSANTSAIIQTSTNSQNKKVSIRAKKMHSNHSVQQKSLESPVNKDGATAADLVPSNKAKQRQASNAGAIGSKKRFYNSMVVSGVVSESQTPQMLGQSNHAKEKFALEDQLMGTHQQISFNNRTGLQISKQTQNGAAHSESNTQVATLATNTPSRRKSRQNQQSQQQQQYVGVQKYSSQGTYPSSTQNVRSTIGSIGQKRRASKQQMSATNSQTQLQTQNIQTSVDYQLNSMSQVVPQPYSPNKPSSKLYKYPINRATGNKNYTPIASGTYNMPNGGRTSENNSINDINMDGGAGSPADFGMYEITPHKQQNNGIYTTFVKQGQQAKMTTPGSTLQHQQEYSVQAAPVTSYYLLHGKYNAKGSKQKSASVKATDLGGIVPGSTKAPNMIMHHLQQQMSKVNPKSQSHGISTPTAAINPLHMMNQAQNQGSVINAPKHIINNSMINNQQIQLNTQRKSDACAQLKSIDLRGEKPVINNAGTPFNRLSEGPPHLYDSEMKIKPNSKAASKRNSMAFNSVVNAESSLRSSHKTGEPQRQARNADAMRTKQNSRHNKRKSGGLSSTQKIQETGSQNPSKMRTNSNKQGKERVTGDPRFSSGQSAQFMSGELECVEDAVMRTSNAMNPRSRGLMLQQTVDRPGEKHRLTQGHNTFMGSSAVNSAMTSPKVAQNHDSTNQSNSRRSHGSSHMVRGGETVEQQDNSLNMAKEGNSYLLQNVPGLGSTERSSIRSPNRAEGTAQKKSYNYVQIGGSKFKQFTGVNVSSDIQASDLYTPNNRESGATAQNAVGKSSKRKIVTDPSKHPGAGQPRILSKTTKNSVLANSKEHLHGKPAVGNAQGQVLINQYVSTKKRGMRRNISGERISSIERTSQVAEQIFLQQPPADGKQPPSGASNFMPPNQKPQPQTNSTKVPSKALLHLQQQVNNSKQLSQTSLESVSQMVSPSMMSAGLTQNSGSESLERFRMQSMGGHTGTQGSSNLPIDNTLMIQVQQEDREQTPDVMSPRSREVALLTKVITDCFEKYNKMPKTRIELYKVGKILGKGAFGKVNLGLHRLTRKLTAIKSTDKDQIKEESTKRKMMQEIEILKMIKHTSHIKLLETFQTAKHYLIVMELCPGGDLLNYVRKRRKLTEKNAKFLFKQIMQGIAYMHEIGIVHRDIKLDNILLDTQGNIKIGDFGVSRRVDREELLFEQCGTPAYIAPEIVQEIGYKGLPVDIWSAGVCLYAILYGNVPFKANQIGDLTHELYQQEIEYRDTVSELARDLMQSMLEKNVTKRLTAKEVLYHPWFDNTETEVDIFDEQERHLICKEFTYILHKSKMREDENRGPYDLNTEFTEHSIGAESGTGLLKNSSTRSVILCPFNSRQADPAEQARLPEYCAPMMEEKDIMLRFGIRVRELDRAYEKFNNQDFDNGVYHKFAYKQQNKNGEGEESKGDPNKHSPRSTTRQVILQRILQEAQIQPERVLTPESEKYAKIDMGVVERVSKYGFPQSTIINSLRKNLANHCTTSYFLLLMDQNF